MVIKLIQLLVIAFIIRYNDDPDNRQLRIIPPTEGSNKTNHKNIYIIEIYRHNLPNSLASMSLWSMHYNKKGPLENKIYLDVS